jgi:hypothetical protein
MNLEKDSALSEYQFGDTYVVQAIHYWAIGHHSLFFASDRAECSKFSSKKTEYRLLFS